MSNYSIIKRIIEYVDTGDMVELTRLVDRLDPEELADTLSTIISTLLRVRSRFERIRLLDVLFNAATNEDIEQLEFELDA